MATTINASASSGLITTADTSTILQLQTGGTTALAVSAAQVVTLTNPLPVASGGSGGTTSTGTGANVLGTTPSFTSTIGVGGATASASGAGITFPAAVSASSDVNTLDDYEEGTWALADTSGAGLSITKNMAQYVKIGRFVMAQFDINYPSTANASSAQFSLPFTSNNDYSSGYFGYTSFAVGITQGGPAMIVNGGFVNARVMSAGGQLTNAQCSTIRLMGTVCYYTT